MEPGSSSPPIQSLSPESRRLIRPAFLISLSLIAIIAIAAIVLISPAKTEPDIVGGTGNSISKGGRNPEYTNNVPDIHEEKKLKDFLINYEEVNRAWCIETTSANWGYDTNMTHENALHQVESQLIYDNWKAKEKTMAKEKYNMNKIGDPNLKRMMRGVLNVGTSALPPDLIGESVVASQEIENTHAKAKICPYVAPGQSPKTPVECELTLESEIKEILKNSYDYEELSFVWKTFSDITGPPLRRLWWRQLALNNKAAKLNGFKDFSEDMLAPYVFDSPTFEADLESLWKTVEPLYRNIHAYVKKHALATFPLNVQITGPLPINTIGHMHGQKVSRKGMEPFPDRQKIDVTPKLQREGKSIRDMVQMADQFFVSMGMRPAPPEFWENSIFEKPVDGRVMGCHPAAYDSCGTNKTLLKMCSRVTHSDLITMHHEMGHIQYYLQYQNQTSLYQDGANPGFHEAVGDAIALAASTPKHLKTIGLLDKFEMTSEDSINYLMDMAFEKIFPLPTSYIYDLFMWNAYRGSYQQQDLNTKWWELHLKYAGLCPPVRRGTEDFEPGTKYHVATGKPYIGYFVAYVLQFQIYEALCNAANHEGPLHLCDFYESATAGKLLEEMMKTGSSKPWPEVLRTLTEGMTNKLDAGSMIRYFQPLMDWLQVENDPEMLIWKSEDATVCP